jgi:hypothetical protein
MNDDDARREIAASLAYVRAMLTLIAGEAARLMLAVSSKKATAADLRLIARRSAALARALMDIWEQMR